MNPPDGESIAVLFVLDNDKLGDRYVDYLDEEFDVRIATSEREAVDRFEETVDVVLVDRQLGDTRYEAVLSELRTRDPAIPVALLTDAEPDGDIVAAGFDEYIARPVDSATLFQVVRVLGNRPSFEAKTREFFGLAAQKASFDSATTAENDSSTDYDDLVTQLRSLRGELDDALETMVDPEPTVVSRSNPGRAETESLLQDVYEHTLPDDVRELVEDYQQLEGARPPFVWKWVHRLAPQNTLPSVEQRYVEEVPVDKTLAILFVTLLDDILEKQQDRATFDEITKLIDTQAEVRSDRSAVDTEYVQFAARVWRTLIERIERAPNYDAYEELFRYDFKQAVNGIEYSDLAIRNPELATMDDLERYESHNMVLFAYADIDLMHSPLAVRQELPTIRKAIWTAQIMARIGNWVSTWKREIRERDYSSGPVVYALNNGLIDRAELDDAVEDGPDAVTQLIQRIDDHGVEQRFLTQWEQHYHQLREYDRQLSQIDLEPFIEGTEEVLRYHLASTGLK